DRHVTGVQTCALPIWQRLLPLVQCRVRVVTPFDVSAEKPGEHGVAAGSAEREPVRFHRSGTEGGAETGADVGSDEAQAGVRHLQSGRASWRERVESAV